MEIEHGQQQVPTYFKDQDISDRILLYKRKGFLEYLKGNIILFNLLCVYAFFSGKLIHCIGIQIINIFVYYLNSHNKRSLYNLTIFLYWVLIMLYCIKYHTDDLRTQQAFFEQIPQINYLAYLIEIVIFVKAVKFQDDLLQELKIAIAETKDAELDLRMLVKLLPEGVLILNTKNKNIQLINRTAIKLFIPNNGDDPQLDKESLGTSCQATHQYYERMRHEINHIIQSINIRESYCKSNIDRNRKPRIRDLHSFLFYKAQSTINLQGQFKMMTNKKQIDYQIVNLNRKHQVLVLLQDLNKVREEEKSVVQNRMQTLYFASIAHDLRTPLNAMMSATQTLKLSNLPHRFNEILEMNVITEVFTMIKHRAEAKKVQLIKIIGDNVPQGIFADKKRVNQVLINLLTNALKFTKKGQVVLRVNKVDQIPRQQISIDKSFNIQSGILGTQERELDFLAQKQNNGYIQVQVIDTGIGISFENQRKLFKNFGKLKDTFGLNENGCGLGLTICKKISESMNGTIMLESYTGVGSTFTFYFQLLPDQQISSSNDDPYEEVIAEEFCFEKDTLSDRYNSKQEANNVYNKSFTALNNKESDRTKCMSQSETELRSLERITYSNSMILPMEELKSDEMVLKRNIPNTQRIPRTYKILIIDDNSFNILALKLQLQMLINAKLVVDQAFSGQDGIDILTQDQQDRNQNDYDLVFVDFNMPSMNGITMMKTIQEQERRGIVKFAKTSFILWSAQSEDQVTQYKKFGFKMFLEKPIEITQLKKIIARVGIPINNNLNIDSDDFN
ncbi:multi-sensor hybrid histidine kinase [Stylonychia lemnae]|uniref:Multi-sensor hybrid histidine kinase n=1 Tax=Stylonychia lemnae TaxID=5949 RepID=A0A078AAG8_STYLE|nr:multi-sensor hybrid histidine kinase [Stylonychia lemnae]|eukprot:CDW77788.1 multi-sensor hybrid histidine kinase [Stylonychia lemnae]